MLWEQKTCTHGWWYKKWVELKLGLKHYLVGSKAYPHNLFVELDIGLVLNLKLKWLCSKSTRLTYSFDGLENDFILRLKHYLVKS